MNSPLTTPSVAAGTVPNPSPAGSGENVRFSPKTQALCEKIAARYPEKRAALLPVLWVAQKEFGWLSPAALEQCAAVLGVPAAHVYGVATFYNMFRLSPTGRYDIGVCATIPCSLVGAKELEAGLRAKLGIKPGERTGDGRFSIKKMECLGLCEHAPALLVNDEHDLGDATAAKLDEIVRTIEAETATEELRPLPYQRRVFFDPSFQPILLKNVGVPGSRMLKVYRERGGYKALEKALGMTPDAVTLEVKNANLRGRGGAGFPTGTKWGFMPKDPKAAKYLCVNADESEPGTFSNRVVMEEDPHLLIEGTLIACYAMGIRTAFIYLRGEYPRAYRALETAIEEAYAANLIGKNILGKEFSTDVVLHRGAGAYICGEEMALMSSLEGGRGEPRNKPPFPAQRGVFGAPTTINNVETLANVPCILQNGAEWYKTIGPAGSPGPKLYCLSGQVKRTGLFELPMGITLKDLIFKHGQGLREGRKLKGVIPGGASAAVMLEPEIDVAMDFDSMAKAGSMLGTAGVVVMDDTVCMVDAAVNVTHFFAHETCGQCTPCREGVPWVHKIVKRIGAFQGRPDDLKLMGNMFPQIHGKTICLFADFALTFLESVLKKFPGEFEAHLQGRCPLCRP